MSDSSGRSGNQSNGYRTTARTRQALKLCVEALMLAGHGPAACRVYDWSKIERGFNPPDIATYSNKQVTQTTPNQAGETKP